MLVLAAFPMLSAGAAGASAPMAYPLAAISYLPLLAAKGANKQMETRCQRSFEAQN